MEITLSDISRRIIFRFYPIWILIDIVGSYSNFRTEHGLSQFMLGLLQNQLGLIFIFLTIFSALHILKPVKFYTRLIIMNTALFTVVGMLYLMDSEGFTFLKIPVIGPFSSWNIWYWIVSGIYLIWFFFLAERSLIAERNLVKEQTRRILQEQKLVKNRLRLLQARIDPHFLFDTMGSIADYFDKDKLKAKTMLSAFIQYLRATLVKTKHHNSTVEQEMDLIRSYLQIYQVGMEDGLRYNMDVAADAKTLPFPSMLIQPVVENCIKHGLESQTESQKINIEVKTADRKIIVIIKNIGHGTASIENVKTALSGVKERIQALFHDAGSISVKEDSSSGFQVMVVLPYD